MAINTPISRRVRYYLVHAKTRNFDLAKELGCMPHTLATECHYEAYLVTYQNDAFPWRDQVPGARLLFLRRLFGEVADVLWFILCNARRIDVLQLIHLHKNKNLVFGFFYKLLNPEGLLYYKLDASPHIMEALLNRPQTIKSGVKTRFLNWMMTKHIDLISVETRTNFNRLCAQFSEIAEKIMYLPNGYHLLQPVQGAETKGKIILTAGRLGTRQKATENLLEAFALVSKSDDWKLILAGPIEKPFQREIEYYFECHPHLRDRVEFLGYVTDRIHLQELYSNARVFCFPSRWESFGIALIEAAFFADYLISTDVGAATDVIGVTDYGCIVPSDDPQALAIALQETITNWEQIDRPAGIIRKRVDREFSWHVLCGRLHERLLHVAKTKTIH